MVLMAIPPNAVPVIFARESRTARQLMNTCAHVRTAVAITKMQRKNKTLLPELLLFHAFPRGLCVCAWGWGGGGMALGKGLGILKIDKDKSVDYTEDTYI